MVSVVNKNFQNGKIHFIGNYIDNDIYIGSSCQTLQKRFQKHKDSMKNNEKKHRKLYKKMIELGVEHFYIEEIEKCPCENIDELRNRERHFIKERQPILNSQIPSRTPEEYREDNKEKKKETDRQYYQKNKSKCNAQSKQYREEHKEEIKEWKKQNYEENKQEILEKQKQYHQEHKEERNAINREYREKNKDAINAKNRTKHQCECGKEYTYGNRLRHFNSQFHQNFLNNNINNV